MATSPSPNPHRRVRSVPIRLNFQITPIVGNSNSTKFSPTSGTTATTPNDSLPSRPPKRPVRRSSGSQSPRNGITSGAYENHPSYEMKRSNSTFFMSSRPSYQHDWTYRHGAKITAERLEEQGRSWLVSRASSTDLAGDGHESDEEDVLYHQHTRDLEILDMSVSQYDDEQDDEEEFNWSKLVRAFMDFGEESDDDDEAEWKPRRRTVAFAEGVKSFDGTVVQRARERDEEHGLDGWMDGAAYLALLGARAIGGFF